MSDKLRFSKEILGEQTTVEFFGVIDEDAEFDELKKLNAKEFVFNLEKIEMLNSCGIREWIKFQEALDPQVKLIYEKCPQIIIEQMNMVKGFIKPGGQVQSFYAPYFNPRSDEEKKVLLKPEQVIEGKAPAIKDPNDGGPLEFDDIEEQYFHFLKYNQSGKV